MLMPADTFGMQKLKLPPSLEAMAEVTAFVEQRIKDAGLPMKLIAQMNIAVDEIFSNIAHYSDAPDTTLSAEEREIGRLGLFIVKKFMDSVEYDYHDGLNILTLKKHAN